MKEKVMWEIGGVRKCNQNMECREEVYFGRHLARCD